MKNQKFVYDEKTSSLFAPDGSFVKRLFCPKAKKWNQLIVEPGETRWRGCKECKQNVLDLDSLGVDASLDLLRQRYVKPCVFVSEHSESVIFLKDHNAVRSVTDVSGDPLKIQTVYGKADIDRGYAMGYWPDVRLIRPDPKMNSKISVGQNEETGEVHYSNDYRRSFRTYEGDEPRTDGVKELYPFFSYYPYHRSEPVAAYLVPKGLPNGTRVVVNDPIENVLGMSWNQGGGFKHDNVPGFIDNNKVVLELDKAKVYQVVG